MNNLSWVFDEIGCTQDGIEVCARGVYNFQENGLFTSTVVFSSDALGGDFFDLLASGTFFISGGVVTICDPNCSEFMLDDNNKLTNTGNIQDCEAFLEFTGM